MHKLPLPPALAVLFLFFSVQACTQIPGKKLVKHRAGKTNYFISIPSDYSLKETQGPDFTVYYFSPDDSAAPFRYLGGFYIGDYPSSFGPDNDSCKTATTNGILLDSAVSWTVYECKGDFMIQTIIPAAQNDNWGSKIHAFGHAASKEDLTRLLEIYSTLKFQH